MSDPDRVYLARIAHALEKISRLAKHKSIPSWISESIVETAETAHAQLGNLQTAVATEKPRG